MPLIATRRRCRLGAASTSVRCRRVPGLRRSRGRTSASIRTRSRRIPLVSSAPRVARQPLRGRRGLTFVRVAHGAHQRALREAPRRLPVSRDRAARARVSGRASRREGDPARHRRRHRAARAGDRRGDARRGRRDGASARRFAATARSRATTSWSRRSASTTTRRAASTSPPTRSSSATAASATAATSRRSSRSPRRIAVTDPVYPVYVDSNVMAGRTGALGARRSLSRPRLPRRQRGERLPARAAGRAASTSCTCARRTTRPAPSRRARSSSAGSRGRSATRRDHPVRRRVRVVHLRSRAAALDLRDPGRTDCAIELRSFSKRAGFTGVRCAFMVIPKTVTGVDSGGQARLAQRAVGAAPHDEVQRCVVRRAARRGGGVLARRARADEGADRVLHGERAPPARGAHRGGLHDLRRRSRAVSVDPDAGRRDVVGVLRPAAREGADRRHAGRRLRSGGRGLLPAVGASTRARTSKRRSLGSGASSVRMAP